MFLNAQEGIERAYIATKRHVMRIKGRVQLRQQLKNLCVCNCGSSESPPSFLRRAPRIQ